LLVPQRHGQADRPGARDELRIDEAYIDHIVKGRAATIKGRAAPGTVVSAMIESKEVAWAMVPLDGRWILTFPHDQYEVKPVVVRLLGPDDNATLRRTSSPLWLKPAGAAKPSGPDWAPIAPPAALPDKKPGVVILWPGQGYTVKRGRIEFTGNAPAGHSVSVMVDGHVLGRTKADRSGRWALSTNLKSPRADRQAVALARDPVTRLVTSSQPVVFSVW
jgi:hypothetical protein